jgi:hypothetical protein
VSYGKTTSYLPVSHLLKAYFKVHDRETHREIREKLTGKLFTLDRTLEPSSPTLEEYVHDHRPHGPLTADATAPAWNGYLLTVACACGDVFGRVG